MKTILIILFFLLSTNCKAYTTGFKPYIGFDTGLNIFDYTQKTDLEKKYYSATINAGARIGKTFGVEAFFSQSSRNNIKLVNDYQTSNHEIYYISYGFDIFAYYDISKRTEFFTTIGVSNHKIFDKYSQITSTDEIYTTTPYNSTTTRFGIGLLYTFPGEKISGIIQYQYVPINLDGLKTISDFSIGMRYTF